MDSLDYQQPIPEVPEPDELPPVEDQLRPYADELGGFWVRPQWIERRYIDAPPRLARDLSTPPERTRMCWCPAESVGGDPILTSCLLTYVTGTTMPETTMTQRRTTQLSTFSAPIDHAIWFQRPADLSDWVLALCTRLSARVTFVTGEKCSPGRQLVAADPSAMTCVTFDAGPDRGYSNFRASHPSRLTPILRPRRLTSVP